MTIPWWPGDVADHLFPTCPTLRRFPAGRDKDGNPRQGVGNIGDPFDSTVCGWCQRLYRRRMGMAA